MTERTIAYFSMEIGLNSDMPTYGGGLGVLAGDVVRAAADIELPLAGVTLLHRKGYFKQTLDLLGHQTESPAEWLVSSELTELPQRVSVGIEGRRVEVRCWTREVAGVGGFRVPVYFLDTDVESNDRFDRTLTDYLYGGDEWYRLCQEIVLGIGGIRMLRALGHNAIERFHLNEGHSALIAFALIEEEIQRAGRTVARPEDVEAVRERCVFTTHTPVDSGHDRFSMGLMHRALGSHPAMALRDVYARDSEFNMTYAALRFSRHVNGVSMEHGESSRRLFSGYAIDAITNGVHAATWVSPPFADLFDRHIPDWRRDNFSLRYALSLPPAEVWAAHMGAKQRLLDYVNAHGGERFGADALTLGFARRATAYKRPELLLHDVERLENVAQTTPLQIVYAGKAHPADQMGKALIARIFEKKRVLRSVKLVYLENYDMALGALMTAGVDVWINSPKPPLEASGTSGMKAALNGVPSLSVRDGWWIEGHIENVTGWSIDSDANGVDPAHDARVLYDKLERVIAPMFSWERGRFVEVMRNSIALNGSFFHAQRMMIEYIAKSYGRATLTPCGRPGAPPSPPGR
jgi:starch phosphorylase